VFRFGAIIPVLGDLDEDLEVPEDSDDTTDLDV
jgi:hypothetical protein